LPQSAIDFLVNAEVRAGDRRRLSKHRAFVVTHLAGTAVVLLGSPVYIWLRDGITWMELAALTWLGSYPLATLLYLRLTARVIRAEALSVLALLLLILGVAQYSGGIESFIIPLFAVAFAEAMLYGDRRLILFASGAIMMLAGGIFIAGSLGLFPEPIIPPDQNRVWLTAVWIGTLIYMSAAAALFIGFQEETELTLLRARDDARMAFEDLKNAQTELVQTEKLASLGALVAGISHEINTPVGVAVTAASHLETEIATLQQRFEQGALKRQELDGFLAAARESAPLISSNLARAADLIQSFKQVAADQTSDVRRRFALDIYLREVATSLKPSLNGAGCQLIIDCPPHLYLDSVPGALAQVITNFVLNAITHAYPPGKGGTLNLGAYPDGNAVTIIFADDGRGIPSAVLPHIFDPFFTTKRSGGGTGLGLNIVFNIVTKTLGGTIRADNAPGRGARFTLRIPMSAPR